MNGGVGGEGSAVVVGGGVWEGVEESEEVEEDVEGRGGVTERVKEESEVERTRD